MGSATDRGTAGNPISGPAPVPAGCFGLHATTSFELATGATAGARLLPQAAWYFRDEIIAVPRAGTRAAGFAPGAPIDDDLGRWQATLGDAIPADLPPLVWVAAPARWDHAALAADGSAIAADGQARPARWVAKIPLNRAYLDATSYAYLSRRPLRLRGEAGRDGFTIRTVWPEDWRLPATIEPRPLGADAIESLRALAREQPQGGARSPFAALRLWAREGTEPAPGAPVLAFLVNGAQGDDDEAHAGHFAIVTGRIGEDGGIGDWLVNDFYTLDSESEKGIVAAPVPLDNYLGDLNAGQAWYRPSTMLVAVLRESAAANLVQSALGRVYNHFYRHQLVYYHPDTNCTSISVDTLRALGLAVPRRPAAHPVLAAAGFPLLLLRARSLAKAQQQCDYWSTDPTRLLPAVALEEILAALLDLVGPRRSSTVPRGRLAALLARDLASLLFVRIPQLPSSRAWGDAPVGSLTEYATRLPRPPAQPVIVPVPPRPLPEGLRPPDLPPPPLRRSDVVAGLWGVLLVVGIPALARALWRRWRARRATAL
jgi:hypothetical protein